MAIPVLESVKAIEQQYRTGEEPVLVMCSDMNAYICKYMRSSAAAYKHTGQDGLRSIACQPPH